MLAVMGPLLALLGVEAQSITDNVKRQAIVWGLIGGMGAVFVAFVLVAINAALSYAVGPVIAPLIIAVVAALIGVGVFLVAHIQDGIVAKREAEKKKSAEMTALITTAIVTAVPLILRSSLVRNLGGAAVASALMSRRDDHRHHK
jgi:ABC-type transport system involved in multi-copper enzyme maturation permease subunit